MRRKGFTLVELIAAIAIFSISIVGISFAFINSIRITKESEIKLQTSSIAQGAIEIVRVQDKERAKNLSSMQDFQFYFNNIDELETCIEEIFDEHSVQGYEDSNGKQFACKIDVNINIDENYLANFQILRVSLKVWNIHYGIGTGTDRIYDFTVPK